MQDHHPTRVPWASVAPPCPCCSPYRSPSARRLLWHVTLAAVAAAVALVVGAVFVAAAAAVAGTLGAAAVFVAVVVDSAEAALAVGASATAALAVAVVAVAPTASVHPESMPHLAQGAGAVVVAAAVASRIAPSTRVTRAAIRCMEAAAAARGRATTFRRISSDA